ncbi:hypothetical protein Tco_0157502 [Tanacetum coccineum]
MELHIVFYGIDSVAAPLLALFSSEKSTFMGLKSVSIPAYGISLEYGPRFDILSNIHNTIVLVIRDARIEDLLDTRIELYILCVFVSAARITLSSLNGYDVLVSEYRRYLMSSDVFESMESDLDATLKQNEILIDQLLEAILKHDVESCVLMCSDSMNDNLNDEIEKVKRDSIDVQENLLKRIKILKMIFKDVKNNGLILNSNCNINMKKRIVKIL